MLKYKIQIYEIFQVSATDDPTTASSSLNSGQLDPSSEAEALSHVASGIAASLGLAADANETDSSTNTPGGPLSDLEGFSEPSETNNQTFETRSGGVKRPRESTSTENSPAKKVSKLAMEWTEDEDDNEEQMPNTNST